MSKIKKNWKTSIAGICAGIPLIANGLINKDYNQVVQGISLVAMGFFSSDAENQ